MKTLYSFVFLVGCCAIAYYADIRLSTFSSSSSGMINRLIVNNDKIQDSVYKTEDSLNQFKTGEHFNLSKNRSLGDSVLIFDPSQQDSEIQKIINTIYERQLNNQFGQDHYAFLFKPGTYHLDVKVGYYTQVIGLGRSPDDVTIIGAVRTQDDPQTQPVDQGPGALNNFWRSVENVSVIPTLGSLNRAGKGIAKDENVWAVSQAAPMRNVHIKQDAALSSSGSLRLFDIGWSSGGFMANTKIDGYVEAGSQQQWIARNSEWNQWRHGNWNIVDVGSSFAIPFALPGRAPKNAWPTYPFTSIEQTPVIAEKPGLIIGDNNEFAVNVPGLSLDSSGVSWGSGSTIPLTQFYVAFPQDTAELINDKLQNGMHILFTPGIYKLSQPLLVTNPGTIVLGIGLPSLMPINGTQALLVSDIDGVRIGGLMIDAGPNNSPTLVQIGETITKSDHSANPTMLYDIFCRVGGLSSEVTKTTTCVTINSNNVVGDNFWIWRADHGVSKNAVGWTLNTADHGLIVNGDNVTIYGLAVEHFQKTQTIWNGENGHIYFYQCELPYDPPSQESWKNGTVDGYPGYKVANAVKKHEAWGLGVYSYFRDASDIYLENAIEAPVSPGVKLQHMITVWLNGNPNGSKSGIRHILNGKGEPAISSVEKGLVISALN